MNNFLLLKLNRAVWVAFLEQEKIEEAIRFFEIYIMNIESFKNNKDFKDDAQDEADYSTALFLNKISQLADNYYNKKDWANAAICYTAYFKYKQDDILSIRNFIETLEYLNQFDLEIDLLSHIEENLHIKDAQTFKLLAELYSKRKDYKKALEYAKKYIENLYDKTGADYNLLGCYYNLCFSETSHDIEDAKSGLEAFAISSDMAPFTKLYAKNATIMAAKVGNNKLGRKYWNRVFEIGGITNDDKYDYAAFCLKNGDFNGWRENFEARFNKENNKTQFPKINKPKWDGSKDLSNSTLLVYFEQGFGDTFLMYGYLPKLTKLAKQVIFVVQDSVYSLFKDNEYGIEIIPSTIAGDLKKIKFDYYIPSMSIPIAMNLNRENISVGEGYIKANHGLVKTYKQKYFNNNKFKIGISVSGNSTGDKTRDVNIKSLLPLDKLENVELYSLTKNLEDTKLKDFTNNKIINLGNEFIDFSHTAAAIENCDLVITTDNCILNLAGGLGKKTFALFNNPNQFRWFDLSGDNTIWLTSVKPFVNKEFNQWTPTINKMVEEVKKLIK